MADKITKYCNLGPLVQKSKIGNIDNKKLLDDINEFNSLSDYSILITGGIGFIGLHIVESMLEHGVKFIRILDNLSTGSVNNLINHNKIELVNGDISNYDVCFKCMDGIDLICHQAALASVPNSMDNPMLNNQINVTGTLNLLHAAKTCGIKRFVFASSSSVYGEIFNLPFDENDVMSDKIVSPYGLSKLINEQYAKLYTNIFGMECIGLRYFNVYGPGQNPSGNYACVIPKFITLLNNNEQPIIYGDGSSSRDYVYVKDIANANIRALTIKSTDKSIFGNSYNIGSGKQISILELFNIIKNLMNKDDCIPKFEKPRNGDAPHTCATTTRSNEILGFITTVDIKDGLKNTINAYIN
jgi:UDP-N-acetylglucosamine 4-epimerase